MEQDKEQHGEQGAEADVNGVHLGQHLLELELEERLRRLRGDCVDTPVGGRLPNLICLGCKFPGILDVLPHQVGVVVWGQERTP